MRRINLFLHIAVLSLVVTLALPAMVADAQSTGSDYGLTLPKYVRVVSDSDAASLDFAVSDSDFITDAGKIIFPVNKFTPLQNDPLLNELHTVVMPLANHMGWELTGMVMRGAASPEGPYDNNVMLANRRANAIIERLMAGNDTVKSHIEINSTPEDYGYLLLLMQRAGDPDTTVVADMIRRYPNVKRLKQVMMSYKSGALWNRLFKTYFAELRAARIIVFFRRVRPVHLQDPVNINTQITYKEPELPVLRVFDDTPRFTICKEHRRHLIALSTNLLEDAFYMPNYGWAPMPNIGVEYFPYSGRFSFKGAFMFPYYHRWTRHQFFQIRNYQLEARFWMRPGWNHRGLYFGLYANAARYGIGLDSRRGWQGEGIGAAAKIGYVVSLGNKYSRWRLEFHAAAGFFATLFDPYVWGNPVTGTIDDKYYYDYTGPTDDFIRRNHLFTWFGPTEVGITISYDLLFHRNPKRGFSFRSTEKVRCGL